jgi:diadenosine tetraphosphate (Ap4A) HIT family hydrolase
MPGSPHSCIFCSEEVKGRILMERGTVYVIEDLYPVIQGHLL